jgi:hypothetical protein
MYEATHCCFPIISLVPFEKCPVFYLHIRCVCFPHVEGVRWVSSPNLRVTYSTSRRVIFAIFRTRPHKTHLQLSLYIASLRLLYLCCKVSLDATHSHWRIEAVGREPPFRQDLSADTEESPLLQAVIRQRLVKTQQAGKALACVVVICKVCRSAMAL